MPLDILLFVLRVVSGLLLFALLIVFFVIVWRDYRSIARQTQTYRRSYGYLIGLAPIDGTWLETGEKHALLSLTTIGRAPTNTIVISDDFASGEHAQLMIKDQQWWLEDRQSRNGTRLNDEPITMPVIVTDGDIIGIGKYHYRITLVD